MTKFISHKSIFLTSALTMGISIILSQNIFAATLATKNYTVKSGDCLSRIAQNYGETLNNLRNANNKWNDSIFPGQVLNVSGTTSYTTKQIVPSATKYTASDLNLLSRLITAEAGGESYNAQVAVGAVVMNRVKNSNFPNSISAVINQKTNGYYQFTCVQNGNINRPAPASDVNAAISALNGNDPSKGALFFRDDIGTSDAWFSTQPVSIRVNDLVFIL